MGIYDRDYYRREGPSFLESLGGRAEVCKWLIVVNVVVFILQILSHELVTQVLILDTRAVADGQVQEQTRQVVAQAGRQVIVNLQEAPKK